VTLDRRSFLALSAAAVGGRARAAAAPPKVAVVFTSCFHRSHTHVILESFLQPYLFRGRKTDPGVAVVSFYGDQFDDRDMSKAIAKEYGIPIYPTVAGALGRGKDELAVDAVLLIGEHGTYPTNAKGQVEYPRKRLFDEVAAVCRKAGRGVPVFNDKHLSYRWDWAKQMYDTAAELKMPLMAGSSVPLAERRPPLELPAGAKITDAVSVQGGPFESYDFHGLEVLQAMIEGRAGGETGVERVQFLTGDALWKAAADGLWSLELAQAAMAAELGRSVPLRELVKEPAFARHEPHGILAWYRSGLKAITLKIGYSGTRWNFACRLAGERDPKACAFHVGPWNNRNLFKALSHAIQVFFREGKSPYPVERTLLTTGVLAAAVDSRADGGKPLDTPYLNIAYAPRGYDALREDGSTWKIITDATPEPPGLDPSGR